jgi:uracil-DNA glycosylase family 4
MDGREKLRRYLEQRREMGETELVLDSMTVEEALRIVSGGSASQGERAAERPAERPVHRDVESGPVAESADWRAALRASGASPETLSRRTEIKPPEAPTPTPPPAIVTREVDTPPRRSASASDSPPTENAPRVDSPISDVPSGLSVGAPGGELFGGTMATLDTLEQLGAHVASCTRCTLYSTAKNPVPGEGSANADLMCVGEAPGATEDETGRPFVGAAGQLLTKILAAIDLKREDVYIVNVLKHRPPGNRNPLPEEVKACSPYLIRQIELIRPKVIIAFGTFAAQTLLDTKLSIGKLRSQIHRYYGVPLIVTYHPAALLRNPSWKRPTWEDVQLARRILDSASPGA